MDYINPYSDVTFFGFFVQLFVRLFEFVTGRVSTLASDEVQLLVLIAVATSCALVGCFLVLRKMTMLANALSHTILIGIVFVYLFSKQGVFGHEHAGLPLQPMLFAAVIMGLITTYLTQFLTRKVGLQEDASTGFVFSSLFAIGIILVTLLTRNAHIGAEVVMGNVDALHIDDLKLVWVILIVNIVIFTLLFKEYHLTTFDASFAKALGFSVLFYDYLLMSQASITTIGAFRAVGVLMVLAFIVTPPLTARLFTHKLKTMLFLSTALGFSASLIGVALSRHLLNTYGVALSTGGLVVCVLILQYLFVIIFNSLKRMRHRRFLQNGGASPVDYL